MPSFCCGSDSFSKSPGRGKHLLFSWTILGVKKSEFLHNAGIFVGKFLQHQIVACFGFVWFLIFFFYSFFHTVE